MRFFVFAAAAFVAAQSHDRLLQEAEDEAEEKVRAFQDEFGGTTFTMSSDGNILGSDDADEEDPLPTPLERNCRGCSVGVAPPS